MQTLSKITATEMRGINRCAVLELIRKESPIARSEIGERLQVSLPTVMRIVDDLIAENLVRPVGLKAWTGGRRCDLLEFNTSGHLVIGIDLGGAKAYGAVADLGGNVLDEIHLPHHTTRGEESFELLVHLSEQLIERASRTGKPLFGIGVGVPGIVDPATGVVRVAPSLDWRDYPLGERLQARLPAPVEVENDVNLAALGELWFGYGNALDSLVFITIGTGIGAGIVLNGSVHRGFRQLAGEVGYLLPDRQHLGENYTGFGAMEQLASGAGIADRARKVLAGERDALELEALTAEDVFAAARAGEAWAAYVIAETVDYLAQIIASIQLILDPERILLGGGVANSADLLIQPILARLQKSIPALPNLQASSLGYRAGVMGAVVKMLRSTADYYTVQKFS